MASSSSSVILLLERSSRVKGEDGGHSDNPAKDEISLLLAISFSRRKHDSMPAKETILFDEISSYTRFLSMQMAPTSVSELHFKLATSILGRDSIPDAETRHPPSECITLSLVILSLSGTFLESSAMDLARVL